MPEGSVDILPVNRKGIIFGDTFPFDKAGKEFVHIKVSDQDLRESLRYGADRMGISALERNLFVPRAKFSFTDTIVPPTVISSALDNRFGGKVKDALYSNIIAQVNRDSFNPECEIDLGRFSKTVGEKLVKSKVDPSHESAKAEFQQRLHGLWNHIRWHLVMAQKLPSNDLPKKPDIPIPSGLELAKLAIAFGATSEYVLSYLPIPDEVRKTVAGNAFWVLVAAGSISTLLKANPRYEISKADIATHIQGFDPTDISPFQVNFVR